VNGGYEDGYRACPCFWGNEPGSLVRALCPHVTDFNGLRVLDVGCGEGKNAAFLASRGAKIDAVDISLRAIQNGMRHWPKDIRIRWAVGDVRSLELPQDKYDIVIAYGFLHCLSSTAEIRTVLARLQSATRHSGFHVVCAFNSRKQELQAHPGFAPSLLSHGDYLKAYSSWQVALVSDSDLTERHPHNMVEHTHSLTRILVRK
jgi:tellurite methyltransferase